MTAMMRATMAIALVSMPGILVAAPIPFTVYWTT